MKNLTLQLLALLVLASCSTPKYSYYFDQYDYNAGKRKKAAMENQNVAMTQENDVVKEIPVIVVPEEQQVIIASTKKETLIVTNKSVNPTGKRKLESISKPQRKELAKQLKSAIRQYKSDSKKAAAPDDDGDGGGNQLVALLLAIFLGGLGIHRFYLGHTMTAIAQLLLLILSAILPPLFVVLGIWVLIDIILIAMGKLTPKSGSYSKPL